MYGVFLAIVVLLAGGRPHGGKGRNQSWRATRLRCTPMRGAFLLRLLAKAARAVSESRYRLPRIPNDPAVFF